MITANDCECGARPILVFGEGDYIFTAYVQCPSCGACGPTVTAALQEPSAQLRARCKAVEDWNRGC